MNFLFWKKKNVVYMEPLIETFSWILWYIWKARNDKFFNGKEISRVDTLQVASIEAGCWRKANLLEESEEEEIELESGEEIAPVPSATVGESEFDKPADPEVRD